MVTRQILRQTAAYIGTAVGRSNVNDPLYCD